MCAITLKFYRNKILLSTLLLICSTFSFGQQRMRFIATDSTPVEKATVRIKSLQSGKPPLFFITDKEGIVNLQLDTGRYTLSASFVNMELINDTLDIRTSRATYQYTFRPLSVELSSVTVTSKKNILNITDDKIVYNVGADEMARSKSLSQVLGNIPFVTVDGAGEVQVSGQTTYKILVNGKETALFTNNIAVVLKSFPANIVSRIELITSPSAKYDAEGVTAIINIITKKFSGYNGFASAYMDNRTKYSDGLTLTAKTGKLGITVNGSLDGIASPLKSFSANTTLPLVPSAYQKRQISATETNTRMTGSGTLELNFEIDSLRSVISSFVISGYKNQKNLNQDITTELAGSQQLSWLYNTTNDRAPSTTIGVDYTKKSGSNAGKYTTFRFNWAGSRNFSDNDGVQQYNSGGTSNKWIKNEAISRNDEFTFQLDAVPVARKSYTIEGGLKAILRDARSDNNSLFTFNLSQPYQEDQDNSNNLHYCQQIYSGYGSIRAKYKKQSVRAGIRVEQTSIRGNFEGVIKPIEEAYFSLIPNLSWTNQISKTTTTILSYNLALQRPFITTLNPFINKIDSFNISYGNPDTKPQKIHRVSMQVRYNSEKIISSIYLNGIFSNDKILSYRLFDINTGISASTVGNAGKEKILSLGLVGQYIAGNRFRASLNSEFRYVDIKNALQPNQHNFGFAGYLGGSFSWIVTNRFTISGSGGESFPNVNLLGQTSPLLFYQINTGLDVIKDKLFITINWNNIHANYFSQETTFKDNLVQNENKRTFVFRSIYFGIHYTFGKLKENVARKKDLINDDIIRN